MPDFNIAFEVYCSCGEGLCSQSEGNNTGRHGMPGVVVEPCQKCLGAAEDAGHEKGYETAEKDNNL